MKEAAGEANMTVITIILIGVIAAIAIPLVNNAMTSTAKKAKCQEIGGSIKGNVCTYYEAGNQKTCTLTKQSDGTYKCGNL